MAKKIILGVQVTDRHDCAPAVQKVLTQYGCSIRTRLGLHEVSGEFCSTVGLLILDTCGPEKEIKAFEAALKEISGVTVKKMVFTL